MMTVMYYNEKFPQGQSDENVFGEKLGLATPVTVRKFNSCSQQRSSILRTAVFVFDDTSIDHPSIVTKRPQFSQILAFIIEEEDG